MKAGVMEVPDLVLVTKGDLGAPARPRRRRAARRALARRRRRPGGRDRLGRDRRGDPRRPRPDRRAAGAGRGLARAGGGRRAGPGPSRGCVESIGRTGFDLLAGRLALGKAPFADVAAASGQVRPTASPKS